MGVFTVNEGCTEAWTEKAVEPFGHTPEGILDTYKKCAQPDGNIWKYTRSIRPNNGRERVVGAALAAALLQAHREQAKLTSSRSNYRGINATLINLIKLTNLTKPTWVKISDLQAGDFVRVSNGFFVATPARECRT